jgi:hypothetical protein
VAHFELSFVILIHLFLSRMAIDFLTLYQGICHELDLEKVLAWVAAENAYILIDPEPNAAKTLGTYLSFAA